MKQLLILIFSTLIFYSCNKELEVIDVDMISSTWTNKFVADGNLESLNVIYDGKSTSDIVSAKIYVIHCQQSMCDGSVFRNRVTEGRDVSIEWANNFVGIFKADTFGNSQAACFDPALGLVLYQKNNQPIGYLELCLSCNNIRHRGCNIPPKEGGLSPEARKLIKVALMEVKVKYEGATHFD